jgi:hypothetical protein
LFVLASFHRSCRMMDRRSAAGGALPRSRGTPDSPAFYHDPLRRRGSLSEATT